MVKQYVLTCLVVTLIASLLLGAIPALAQSGPDAHPYTALNMRAGPGTDHAVITVLHATDGLILEGRNADTSWVLGHTEDGTRRGWVMAIYLTVRNGFSAAWLPISDEIVSVPTARDPAAAPAGESVPASVPVPSGLIWNVTSPRVQAIIARGKELGNNAHTFIKIGDCNSASEKYLKDAYLAGQVDLGPYAQLQSTIDFFGGAFGYFNGSASPGFSILSVMDPMYRHPQYCHKQISPFECDVRLVQPAVALIMPTAGDVYGLTDYEYGHGIRQVINYAIERGIVPVLVTYPVVEREAAINGTLRVLAGEYGIPLIDFAAAARALPGEGRMAGDTVHLEGPLFLDFTGDQDRYGFTLLNLLALQTLDQLRPYLN